MQTIPAAFTAHPRWQRMLIGLAGPVANFLLALVLMVFYFAFINEVPLSREDDYRGVGHARVGRGRGRPPDRRHDHQLRRRQQSNLGPRSTSTSS